MFVLEPLEQTNSQYVGLIADSPPVYIIYADNNPVITTWSVNVNPAIK